VRPGGVQRDGRRDADQRLVNLFAHPDAWAHKAILNVAGSGKFSSDRTIAGYAANI